MSIKALLNGIILLVMIGSGNLMDARADHAAVSPPGNLPRLSGKSLLAKLGGSGRIVADLPMTMIHGVPTIKVRLNGRKDEIFLIDSGSMSLLDKTTVATHGMHLIETRNKMSISGLGYTGETVLSSAAPLHLEIGSKLVVTGDIFVSDLSQLSRQLGISLSGIIGYDIICQYTTLLDYAQFRVTFYEAKTFHEPLKTDVIAVDLDVSLMRPFFYARVCVGISQCGTAKILVDTGNQSSGEIYSEFASLLSLRDMDGWKPQIQQTFVGIVETLHGLTATISEGDKEIEMMDISLAIPGGKKRGPDPFDISLGSAAFAHGMVLFEANKSKILFFDLRNMAHH